MNFGWPEKSIDEIVKPVKRLEKPIPGKIFRQVGVRLWGQGAYERESIDGINTKYKTLNRTEIGDIILNKIWARNGSVSVILDGLEGCYVSSEFPLFQPDYEKLEKKWFYWITKTRWFWHYCDIQSRGTSGKNRIRPEKFLKIRIPIPPLSEQRRIVSKIEKFAAKINERHKLHQKVQDESYALLRSAFRNLLKDTTWYPMKDIAPIIRRPVDVNPEEFYPELGIRSFGKGTFHKKALSGYEVGTKRLYWIFHGDLVFHNVFSWEGAIAVIGKQDEGRVGSHRFITCVPKKGKATSDFLLFYFMTPEGLNKIGQASPGGAGRNRTLGLKKLEKIEVPVPPYNKQIWFNNLQIKGAQIKKLQTKATSEIDALLPSILDRAFKGEL